MDQHNKITNLLHSVLFICMLTICIKTGPVLNNLPITFQMLGVTTYDPDSGAASLNGYKLRVGYTGHSWLGVQFPQLTKSDVLVLKASDFYSQINDGQSEGHQILVDDYHWNSSVGLQIDQNTDNDISTSNYTLTKRFELQMVRYLGSNSGQDWNSVKGRYSVQKICFYTSSSTFDTLTWKKYLSTCQYFQIDNLVSKFIGKSLKSFTINGYRSDIYGWIDGPFLKDNVYIFQEVPLFTYTREPAIILELGQTEGNHGQDYYVDSPVTSESGDYFGESVTTFTKDSVKNGGYENNGLSSSFWNAQPAKQIAEYSNTALRITFSRNVSTYDDYDKRLLSTFIFCLHIYTQGTINSDLSDKSCEIVQLSYSFPRQLYQSFEKILSISIGLFFMIFSLMFLL